MRQRYFKSWKSYSVVKKTGSVGKPKPPNKRKNYQTTRWKKPAIKFVAGSLFGKRLRLSMGKGRPKLDIPLPKSFDMSKSHLISTIDLVYNYGQWVLHFTYRQEIEPPESGSGISGVDIGEIHPIVSHDGQHTDIYNGRYIRSLYRHRNKVLAEFSHAISRCKRHSRKLERRGEAYGSPAQWVGCPKRNQPLQLPTKRWWKLTRRKWKRIRKIDNQIKDALQKHTTRFVLLCAERGIGTIVLGDLTKIRERAKFSKKSNQKIHQWAFSKITELITYKAKMLGIKVVKISEVSYTSQTCPKCGNRKKPTNRNYTCPCGYTYHRDGVGAINIRQKYLDCLGNPVVADMARPLGFRLEVPCCLVLNTRNRLKKTQRITLALAG